MDDASVAIAFVDAVVWLSLSVAVGYVGHRLPARWLARDSALTRLRTFELDGTFWQRRLKVRRWKDRLPDAGAFFGGVSKKRVRRTGLARLLVETRRAELVHWALLACGPVFALWNPPVLAATMVCFAVIANVPCLVVQRFNRARLLRVLQARPRALVA
jgi:glycosyl-4,4'-diaponeurosporenoate acyltransferase